MRTKSAIRTLAGLGLAMAHSVHAQVYHYTGTVTDNAGKPLANARVYLENQAASVRTDNAGKYALDIGTVALQSPSPEAGTSVEFENPHLRIDLASPQSARIAVFTLEGHKVKDLLQARLQEGRYTLDLSRDLPSFQSLVIRADIGPLHRSLVITNGNVRNVHAVQGSQGTESHALLAKASAANAAATVDTLAVIAEGYARGAREVPIAGGSGTADFRLGPLKYTDVPYKSATATSYEKQMTVLDVHKPATGSHWPVVMHIHGGGMSAGGKDEGWTSYYNNWGQKFIQAGFMVVSPAYRLSGTQGTTYPDYIRDAAAAAVWVRKNIEAYGGDPNSVFIGGFSAGAELTHLIFLDTTYFEALHFHRSRFAGFIAISGQTKHHYTIARDLGIGENEIMAKKPWAMPMGHIQKTTTPYFIMVGGKEGQTITDDKELYDSLVARGSTDIRYKVIPDQPHTCNDMGNAASIKRDAYFEFIDKYRAKAPIP